QLRASHVGALEERILPEQRQVGGADGSLAVADRVADEDRGEPGGDRPAGERDQLAVDRVSRRVMRAVADPDEDLLARGDAGEPPIDPVGDRWRRRFVAEKGGAELPLRGE